MSLLVALLVALPIATAVLTLVLWRWPLLQQGVAVVSSTVLTLGSIALVFQVQATGIQIHVLSGWPPPFGIVLVADLLSASLAAVSASVFLAALVYSLGYMPPGTTRFSYLPLFFFLHTGVNGAFLTGDIFNLFVFFEIMLLSIYGLVLTSERDSLVSRKEKLEATFKFLVLNLIGAAVMLLAIATLYGTTGTLNMAHLSILIADFRAMGATHLDLAAFLFIVVFGLKAAAAPFHFWLPDVHPSAPTPISALLSGILIKVGAYGLIRLTTLLFPGVQVVSEVILLMAIATLLLGAVLALGQLDLKRLLAYSSISQMGFLLLGVGLGTVQGLAAAVFFLINHALIKSMLFLGAGSIMHITRERSLDRMGGLARGAPFLAFTFLLGVMALSGLPPVNGFISKLLVFQALLESGRLVYLLLALVGAFLGILYAFRAWLRIFWGQGSGRSEASVGGRQFAPIAALAGLLLVFGLLAEPLVGLTTAIAVQIADPNVYIDAVCPLTCRS
ncbi:MAG: proton-conducting transporter membrane subunit [Thermoplasmata archaeon]